MLCIAYGEQFPRCTEYCINACESYDVANYVWIEAIVWCILYIVTVRRIVQFSPLVR